MAQALCSRTLVPAALSAPVAGVRASRSNASLKMASKRLAVSASLKESQEFLNKEENQNAVATTVAASVFSLLATAPSASAAQMVAELADDVRPLAVLGFLVPALGWVLFQIAKPALNQINAMRSAKAVVGALGMGAAGLLMAQNAEAAQLVGDIAEDNRALVLFLPLVAAVGWVLFQITGPALRQLSNMTGGPVLPNLTIKSPAPAKKGTVKGTAKGTTKGTKKGLFGVAGLAALGALSPESADAAQEVATLAADNRPLILLLVLGPAVGWVLFQILRPALNQLAAMQKKK